MKSLASEGLKPLFHQLDINDVNSIITAAAFFKEKYGGVDVLINNAGIAFKGRIQFSIQVRVIYMMLNHRKNRLKVQDTIKTFTQQPQFHLVS